MAVNIQGNQIVSTASKPNIDADYGPYTGETLQEALNNAESALRYKKSEGKTVGLKVGTNAIIEYWYKFDTNNDLKLTEKTPDLSGKQDVITSNNTLDADLIDDSESAHKFVSSSEKTTWNGKQNALTQEQLANITKGGTALQPAPIATGLLKDDGTVDIETQNKAANAIQIPDSATEDNFVTFDDEGNIKDSGCSEDNFVKGVQQNGIDLTKDANGKVNVTVQNGENGKSAYILWCEENNLDPTDPNTPSITTWLASLKANIGAFKFVTYDSFAESAFTTSGIGTAYTGTIDSLVAGTDTTKDVILLMNNTDGTTQPTKTMMITTEDDGNDGYQFVYAGDLNNAIPSNALTESNFDDTHLVNPASNSLAKAGDVTMIKQALGSIEIEETLVASYEEKIGYINGATGQKYVVNQSTVARYAYINVEGYKRVRFNGLLLNSNFVSEVPVGFAFGTMSGTNFNPIRYLSYEKGSNESNEIKEYIMDIPTGCTHFAVTTVYNILNSNNKFYCYLQRGVNIKESIKGIHKEYAVYSKSNGSVTREVIWNIDLLEGHTYKFYAKGVSVSGTSSFYVYEPDGITVLYQFTSISTTKNEVVATKSIATNLLGCTIHAAVNATDTVIYGVEDITNQKIIEKAALINGLDDEPTQGSSRLVKSGGVFSNIPLCFKRSGTVTSTAVGNAFSLKNINLQNGKRYKIIASIDSSACTVKIVKSTDISDIIETLSNSVSSSASPATLYYIPSEDLKGVAIAHYINGSGATVEVSIEELSEVKLREDITALNTRVTAIENSSTDTSGDALGIVKKEMTVPAGEHSSIAENDRLIFPIRQYAYHKITLKNINAIIKQSSSSPSSSIGIYAYRSDGEGGYTGDIIKSDAPISAGESINVTWRPSRDDYEFIGVYFVIDTNGSGKLELSCDTNYSDVVYGKEKYNSTHDIVSMNTESIRRTSSINTKFRHYGELYETERYLCLLMMTDTHLTSASDTAMTTMKRAFTLGEHSLFNAIIHGGDLVETPSVIANIKTAYKNLVLDATKPVLALAGNHDCGGTTTDAVIQDLLFNEDLVGHNGETHPTINNETKNYYYKDITVSGNVYRIIGLYSYEWGTSGNTKARVFYTQDQIDWLLELLDDTPSTTPVAILSHTAISPVKFIDSPFNDPNKRNLYDDTIMDSYMDGNTFFYKIIDAWVKGNEINETATQTVNNSSYNIVANKTFSGTHIFIGNICGHKHSGGVGYLAADDHSASPYRIIIQPTTNPTYTQNTGWWRRSAGAWNEDCLNAIVYGKYQKGSNTYDKLSIIRFGQYINLFGEDCKAFTF